MLDNWVVPDIGPAISAASSSLRVQTESGEPVGVSLPSVGLTWRGRPDSTSTRYEAVLSPELMSCSEYCTTASKAT